MEPGTIALIISSVVILLVFLVLALSKRSSARSRSGKIDISDARSRSGKIDISDPPLEASKDTIDKSEVSLPTHSSKERSGAEVFFETEDVKATSIGVPTETRLERTLISLGDPRRSEPSRILWNGAKFELHVWFFVHNLSAHDVKLKDIKAQVYHVSMYRLRLAMIPWAPRVELAMDNTADLSSIPAPLRSGDAQAVHLVFETSIFDTLFTTLVFGLTAHYSMNSREPSVYQLPSDRIFIFQHDHHWKADRCHFVARDASEIDEVEAQAKSHKAFFESLRSIHAIHTSSPVRDEIDV